jgi:hypothetical protein
VLSYFYKLALHQFAAYDKISGKETSRLYKNYSIQELRPDIPRVIPKTYLIKTNRDKNSFEDQLV